MRNSYKRKRTLKTKIPPALSHDFLLDQQKKKIDLQNKKKWQKNEKGNKEITQQKCQKSKMQIN